MIETTTTCPQCGGYIRLEDTRMWLATCATECATGAGETPEDALEEWGRHAGYLRAPRLTDAASFIVPPPPEGFVLTASAAEFIEAEFSSLTHAEAMCRGAEPVAIYYGPARGQKVANQ